ncbi:MAG: hydrogen gas-evolving membrane-bound hydrogenase subunit E [Acidimicrobiales bacterium]
MLLLCALAPAATVAWAAARAGGVLNGHPVTEVRPWVGDLGVELSFRLDGFALLMLALVSGVGVAVFVYAWRYFAPRPDLGRFAGLLTAFAGAMLGIVLTDNLLVLYVCWELTSVTSYLLIGFEDTKPASRAAALQALLVTGAGGLAMLGGFVLLGQAAGTYTFSEILASPPSGGTVGIAAALVLAGAFTKSAQVPFQSWLPGAMAAPTPVSAYLHSATMVKAGVYLIARFAPALAPVVVWWRPVVVGVGVVTMLVGGLAALRQHDVKLLLAHGTVSQLGFLVALFGAGWEEATFAAAALMLAHGLFKATLFMTVGIVDHAAHTRDLRQLSGLHVTLRPVAVVAVIATASMAGLPPFLGFVAKEAGLEALLHEGSRGLLVLGGIVVGSALTVAYGARYVWGTFATKPGPAGAPMPSTPVDQPGPAFLAPVVALTVGTVVLGALPVLADPLVGAAATSLDPRVEGVHLQLWHGVSVALGLSALAIVVGTALFLRREVVARLQARLPATPSGTEVYHSILTGTLHLADRVTAVVQSGSLPRYLQVTLVTLLALPGVALLRGPGIPTDLPFAENPLQLAVGVLVVGAAVAAARARRRFAAVLCLGGVGYGVAVLFVVQGAPDLALTQLLVETLAVVVFVLVLRHLPERFSEGSRGLSRVSRVVISAGVGVFVASFAVIAGEARRGSPVSGELLERALPDGGGRNVVNVILVDFRALDTLGEITVLAVAALGIASLVLSGRSSGKAGTAARDPDLPAPEAVGTDDRPVTVSGATGGDPVG